MPPLLLLYCVERNIALREDVFPERPTVGLFRYLASYPAACKTGPKRVSNQAGFRGSDKHGPAQPQQKEKNNGIRIARTALRIQRA